MSERVPKFFTIPFLSFILIILFIASWLIGGSMFDHSHDTKAMLILSIVLLAVVIGVGVTISHLFGEIKEIRKR